MKDKGPRFQFRLRTLLITILVTGGALGWIVRERIRNANHRAALSFGATMGFSLSQPAWHRLLFGDDPRYFVGGFYAGSNCDDAKMAHLEGLENLTFLSLSKSKVTDQGLLRLRQLPMLTDLELRHTAITDAGLANLKDCKIQNLDVTGTKVTKTGRLNFYKSHPNAKILPIPDE
jgi:hypothetical protein